MLVIVYLRGSSIWYCIIAERNGVSAGANNSNKIILFYICGLAFPLQAGLTPDGKIKVPTGLTDLEKVNSMAQSLGS